MGKQPDDWRVLIAVGLVMLLLGVLIRGELGGTLLKLGLISLVAGGVWRILKGPDRGRRED
jgi:hypothetical protein